MARITNGFLKLNQTKEPEKLMDALIPAIMAPPNGADELAFQKLGIALLCDLLEGRDLPMHLIEKLKLKSLFNISTDGHRWFARTLELDEFIELRGAHYRLLCLGVLTRLDISIEEFTKRVNVVIDPQRDQEIKDKWIASERSEETDRRQRSRNKLRDLTHEAIHSREAKEPVNAVVFKLHRERAENARLSRSAAELHGMMAEKDVKIAELLEANRRLAQVNQKIIEENMRLRGGLSPHTPAKIWTPSRDPEPNDDLEPEEWNNE